jgi:hypothetical protein
MSSARRHFARSLLLASTLGVCLLAPNGQSSRQHGPEIRPADAAEIAGIRPEGRLRKLHLVRPDLIPYPIAYEVYC